MSNIQDILFSSTISVLINKSTEAAGGQRPSRPVFCIQKPSATDHYKPCTLLVYIFVLHKAVIYHMVLPKNRVSRIWWLIIILPLKSLTFMKTIGNQCQHKTRAIVCGLRAIRRCPHSLLDIPGSPKVHHPNPGGLMLQARALQDLHPLQPEKISARTYYKIVHIILYHIIS